MNHLGTGGNSTIPGSGACASLSMVASSIQRVGHGLTNPDTVIWDALPWDCSSKGTYNYGGLSDKKDKPKPMYYVFRQNTNKMPVATGPDTSQWENPLNGRMFNGERMTFDNMVKYTYLTAVRGYTYNPGNVQVSPFGANFMFWEKSFYSKELSGSPQVTDQWRTAMLNFINTAGNEKTNMQCPANINCTQ